MAALDPDRQRLLAAWQALAQTMVAFTKRAQSDAALPAWAATALLPAWAPLATGSDLLGPPDRDICISVIARLEFFDDQPPPETLVMPGLLGATDLTLKAARAVNVAKSRFKDAVLALRRLQVDVDRDPALVAAFQQDLLGRSPLVGATLRRNGLARLALKQCYRHIPILPDRPKSVHWTWARTRAITRISVQQAEVLLKGLGTGPAIELQLVRLASLPATEVLARVQDCAPHLRANVVYAGAAAGAQRQMINAPIPVLYPALPGSALPEGCQRVKPDMARKEKPERKRRNDQRLEPEPFLPAIRAHRYLRSP